jgi:hypothetical protein
MSESDLLANDFSLQDRLEQPPLMTYEKNAPIIRKWYPLMTTLFPRITRSNEGSISKNGLHHVLPQPRLSNTELAGI